MTIPADLTFACPDEMKYWSEKVFRGEYDVAYSPETPPVILDIGANCGAFALWAIRRWPGATVHSYEPAAVNYFYLSTNTKGYANITTQKAAVLASGLSKLYVGKTNQGEASFFPELGQTDDTYELPPVIRPGLLPKCDVLKVDTEGAEVEIITGCLEHPPTVIMFEYHRDSDRRDLDSFLTANGYLLIGADAPCAHRGVMKYLRQNNKEN